MKRRFIYIILLFASLGCSPEQRCYLDADCENPMICREDGECEYICIRAVDCGKGFTCEEHMCKVVPGPVEPEKKRTCPADMSLIGDAFCMDKYEASRPDATSDSAGTDNSRAVSKSGVMPWMIGDNNAGAEAACQAAGKRLCSAQEWEYGCRGVHQTTYGYGDEYDAKICNGLDTFGNRTGFHIMPTGSFANCNNGWDVYDLSGNLWEHTAQGDAKTVRGGAYNCSDSQKNHQCSYVPRTWTPLSIGFRCCSDGEML